MGKLKGVVYMITSPTGRLYVGSTINLKRRIQNYKGMYNSRQSKLYNSFKKHGFEKHTIEIIWEGPRVDMLKRETQIAWGFNTLDKEHLNCKVPKLGDVYSVVSYETKTKMSKWQVGRKMSTAAKKKMSKAAVGRKHSKESLAKRSKTNGTPIAQYTKNMVFVKNWDHSGDASRALNINQSHISECVRGDTKWSRKSAGGYMWVKIKKI